MIGPGDITQDTKLQAMGDAAVDMITIHHYSADYKTPENQEFVKAWKKAYGADSTPDFMAVGGYDGMAAIAHIIKEQNGEIDGDRSMELLKGWSYPDSPRGPIMIDARTRDIIMNEQVHQVVRKGNRLAIEVIGRIEQVKDPCKELKIGKCAE